MAEKKREISILNRRARFEYSLEDHYEAGMQLTGTEIKSIRAGNASIAEAYCVMEDNELYLVNAHISEYKQGTYNNHIPTRRRKLLLKKPELKKLAAKLKDKGYTVVPLRIFESDSGYAKLEIALGRGKKAHDKREDIKKQDVKRELERYE